MNCIQDFIGPDGEMSILHPELVKEYGESAALTKFREVAELYASGQLEGYPTYANGEPKISVVRGLVTNGTIGQPTAVMLAEEAVDRVKELVSKSIAVLTARAARYADPKASGTALEVSAKTRKELGAVLHRLKTLEDKAAYVELVKFADKQLREFTDFVKTKFNASKAAASDGRDMQAAALDEIRTQLGAYDSVFAPDLAVDDTVLKGLLAGSNGVLGLQRQKEELEKLLDNAQLDLLVELGMQQNNREGLSEAEYRKHILGGLDVSVFTKALGGASQSSSKLLSLINTLVDMAKLRARDSSHHLLEELVGEDKKLTDAGVADKSFMLALDSEGKATGQYVQKIGRAYWDTRKSLKEAVEGAGQYIPGSGISEADKKHNIALKGLKDAQRAFKQAEVISDEGVATDGDSHRYTAKFKGERAKFEELRKNGKYYAWGRKAGLLGYSTLDEANEAYERYLATYYGDPVEYMSMKSTYIGGQKAYTGEVELREGRFTKEAATTEIVEENYRDSQYASILSDSSKSGAAKLAYYNYFTSKLDEYVRALPKEDADHIRRGELPAVMADVSSRYNSKKPGYLDYLGRAVTNPLATFKSWTAAAELGKSGIRLGEDGTVRKDVEAKYIGRFKSDVKIGVLTSKLEGLDKASPTYEADKRKLETALTIEQNRISGSLVETDLSKLLYLFGASTLNYRELKQQEGTLNLLRDAIANRTYYEEDAKGNLLLTSEGAPIPKKNYAPQLQKQAEDWLSQNYYQDTKLGKDELEVWGRRFKSYVSITFQGLNYAAALKNLTAGNLSSRIYAAGGALGFDKKTMNWAFGEVSKDGLSIIADKISQRLEGNHGLVIHPSRSKVDALMHRYGFMEHQVDLSNGGLLNDIAFAGTTVGEYHIQSQLALAKLKTTEVIGLDGKTSNAYDVQSLVNGKLVVDPNYEAAWKKIAHRVTLDIRNIIKHTQGNHSSEDKVALEKEWIGASILTFHRWINNGFKNRWGRAQFDEGIGITTEGYYHGVARLAKAIKKLHSLGAAWHTLSDHDKALVKMALQEMKYIAGTLGLLLIAGALKPDPTDDDKHLLYVGTNLFEIYNLSKNPAAGLGIVRDFGVELKNLAQVPYYGLSGNMDKLDYQTGTRKGDSKLWKSTKDLIPILRMSRIWEQAQTTGQPWIK